MSLRAPTPPDAPAAPPATQPCAPLSPADVALDAPLRALLARKGDVDISRVPLWLVRGVQDVAARLRLDGAPFTPLPAVRDERLPCGLRLRVYEPAPRPGAAARRVVLYVHGGGFVLCSLTTHDDLCRRLARATGFAVVAVGYRKPPEHPAPALHADVGAAYARAAALAAARGARVIVAGDSAGGNLVAALCVALAGARAPPPPAPAALPDAFGARAALARLPPPALQVLLYASMDATSDAPSHARYARGWILSARLRREFSALALGGEGAAARARGRDWAFSPALAPRALLAAVPYALIVSAEHDMVRDDGERYADLLLGAGGAGAEFRVAEGLIHGFATQGAIPRARAAVEDVARRVVALSEAQAAAGEGAGAGGGGLAGGAGAVRSG
jgi:acetyl esterase